MSNLNPDQFFHGTTHDITNGMVLPADKAGTDVSEYSFGDPGDLSEGDHAFAIRNHETYAWHAAQNFHSTGRRARVYEVEPAHDMKPGPWNKEHPDFLEHHELPNPDDYPHVGPDSDDYPISLLMREDADRARENHQDEWASPTGYKIKSRIDIKPGRQGTFPPVNWNNYKISGGAGTDANHPEDVQVKYGMVEQQGPHGKAYHEKREIEEERAPRRQQGRSLRAFMEGRPDEPPRLATLF